jgi:hypothetical protein
MNVCEQKLHIILDLIYRCPRYTAANCSGQTLPLIRGLSVYASSYDYLKVLFIVYVPMYLFIYLFILQTFHSVSQLRSVCQNAGCHMKGPGQSRCLTGTAGTWVVCLWRQETPASCWVEQERICLLFAA